MAPLSSDVLSTRTAVVNGDVDDGLEPKKKRQGYFLTEVVWPNVAVYTLAHLTSLYALYLALTFQLSFSICFYGFLVAIFTTQGILAGAHRYWSHRTYKATFPLRVYLMVANTLALQNTIWEWTRDHRQHHKYSDTDADPHNANRGFFFSHAGWLMMRKHPAVIAKGKNIDMSDVEADPLVRFQRKYYIPFYLLCTYIVAFYIPMTLLKASFWHCFLVPFVFRTVYFYNVTWLVNSAAHHYGYKPYDKNIRPRENKAVSRVTLGEGWHNYHHTFPWDYRAAEFGGGNSWTTNFIDFCAKFGMAYDLRLASDTIIKARAQRTGDGNWPLPPYAH